MYDFGPVTERVMRIRERYRTTIPTLSSERARLITEYYQANEDQMGVLKRAGVIYHIVESMTILVGDDDLIVGNQAPTFRGSNMNPEYGGLGWLIDEFQTGKFFERNEIEERNEISAEDRAYYERIAPYWEIHSISAHAKKAMPQKLWELDGTSVLPFIAAAPVSGPIGHFSAGYTKVINKGCKAIRQEAVAHLEALDGKVFGDSADKYQFYRSVIICCDAAILLAKRYALECRKLAGESRFTEERKAELMMMADSLDWIMENPARTFYEAVQATFLYHLLLCLEGQMHGLTLGRFDQYTGSYFNADVKAGKITRAYAQEILDTFFLKISEAVRVKPIRGANGAGGYSSGQHISLGGVDKAGNDATNEVSYLMLGSMARLQLHQPPLSLRVHKDTPSKLWEAAIECTKRVGGIPTLQNDDVIIPALLSRGFTLEDARDYCIIGCVEPAGAGNDFPACGGCGQETYINQGNIIVLTVNNGINPLTGKDCGCNPGYLYEFETFEEVKDAYVKMTEYFVGWHFSFTNIGEALNRQMLPLPMASTTIDGCMESGKDVLWGGAKYNSMGSSGVGCANVVDSLCTIKYMVYDKKYCTARELYDAIMANWEGHELLRQQILNEVPRYGNDDPYVDEIATWAMDVFAHAFQKCSSYRSSQCQAGIYPVSTHVGHGQRTWATPDGRKTGEPLADGVSPMQGLDKNGPAAVLKSVAAINHVNYVNGTLLNMKFHPSATQGAEGNQKLRHLVETFFQMGGMHIQYNVVGADQLRKAQEDPETYKNLVVRIAGFSAFFVELHKSLQDDLISRTDQRV